MWIPLYLTTSAAICLLFSYASFTGWNIIDFDRQPPQGPEVHQPQGHRGGAGRHGGFGLYGGRVFHK